MEHAPTDAYERFRLAQEQVAQVQHAVEEFEAPAPVTDKASALARAGAALRDAIKLLESADLRGA